MATKANPTNTVLLIRNAAASDFGGAETYPISQAKILQQQGWNPIVVTASQKLLAYASDQGVPTVKGKWLPQQNWTGTRILLIPFYILWQVYLTFWYVGLIKKTGARTLHIQSRDDFIGGTFAGKLLHRTVVWTDHMDLRYIFENITKPFRNIVGKLVFTAAHSANHIILISDNEHRLVTAHFPKPTDLQDTITIIKNGVIDQRDSIAEQPHQEFIFCIASRLVTNKGVGEAIEAFKLFKQMPNTDTARLSIYGDGKDADLFEIQARDVAGINFHGHTTQPLTVMAQSNVYMLPSYQEGFSIALLEALMLGKAIIASDVDSNPEIVTHQKTGLLVPPRDPQALAEAMRMFYQNPTLIKQYGEAARQEYVTNYNLETIIIKQILPLY